MSILRKLDVYAGCILRWLTNLVTGNTFLRMQRLIMQNHFEAQRTAEDLKLATSRLRDELEREKLERFKTV